MVTRNEAKKLKLNFDNDEKPYSTIPVGNGESVNETFARWDKEAELARKNRTIFEKIFDGIRVFFRKSKNLWFSIKCGIPNVIKWMPVVWKDRNWDFAYMDYMIVQKLKFMYKVYSNHESYVCDEEETIMADQIKEVLDLFEKAEDVDSVSEWGYDDKLRTQAYNLIAKNSNGWWD